MGVIYKYQLKESAMNQEQLEANFVAQVIQWVKDYGDVVEHGPEAYSLSDFVTFLLSEIADDSARTEVKVALEAIDIINS
jgi:hemerythrin-like domain-containing protein